MRKILLAAVGLAALAGGCGFAAAQGADAQPARHRGDMVFQADANNDGVVTRQEFDAGRAARFTQADANHDGQIARDEMRGLWGGGEGHRGHRGRGMHSMHGADANNDGAITRDEFLAGPIEHFNRLDANHDGSISATEMPQRRERADGEQRRERPRPDANGDHQLSQAEFTAQGASMFDRLDGNHDGRVTREEAAAARPHRPQGE